MTEERSGWATASFRVYGTLPRAEVAKRLARLPDPTNPNSRIPADRQPWLIASRLETNRSAESHVEDVLAQVETLRDRLRLLDDSTLEIFVGASSGSGNLGILLPRALLARIAELGLDLSLDLYP